MSRAITLALAGLMVVTAVYCLGRAVRARAEAGRDVVHATMAAAMAAMLAGTVGAVGTVGGRGQLVGLVGFALAALWFARTAVREVVEDGPRAVLAGHGVWLSASSTAMVAMLAMTGGSGLTGAAAYTVRGGPRMAMPGMGAPMLGGTTGWTGVVVLALAAALVVLALAPDRCRSEPRLMGVSCQVAMGLTMAYSLITMAT